jgi:SRSO17 transposase
VESTEEIAVAAGHRIDPVGWRAVLDEVVGRIGGRFARVEPRRTARDFVTGLLSEIESKTCWGLAEQAGHARPDAMQRLLRTAVWDTDGVRDDVRAFVADRFGDPQAVLIPDETGDLKKGVHSVGVQRQYSGTAGRIENAQVAVYVTYAGRHGHALIDRRLYLPRSWADDRERRTAAGVPHEVSFATKPQLAGDMIDAAMAAQVPAGWVAADEAYGNDPAFRGRIRGLQLGYVLAVSCDHRITIEGKVRVRADRLVAGLPASAWQRRSAGIGAKGPRYYDWAWLTDTAPDTDAGHHSLLIRRNNTTGELAFYRCWTPQPATLAALVAVAGIRWSVEESFQAAKGQVGLDQHQVRQWTCWHRFTILAIAALAILAVCAAATSAPPPPGPYGHARPGHRPTAWTVNEIRRLFNTFIITTARGAIHRLRWSIWRTWHQARARQGHYQQRLTTELTT